ncbi:MAG TPA: ADP-ribosylglycohydrolase family protein [Chloroflexia bacterium]|nr:ADP-ribosylglycohydrolase family protein [Chloroflexia bacterium]
MVAVEQTPIERALISLEGLSVGDAFGEQFFVDEGYALAAIHKRVVATPPEDFVWSYTDDTNMALSIYSSLKQFNKIEQDWLAQSFAQHYEHDRGYGVGMYRLLKAIKAGRHWKQGAKDLFYGEGSYGNGAAMRVAPVGAFFADDLALVVEQARLSAEVTHAHQEGIAGAIGIAVGTALACQWATCGKEPDKVAFLTQILELMPESEVKLGVETALRLPDATGVDEAVQILGNGTEITAQDTVPFALWCAAKHLGNYKNALWYTVSGLGDRDTTCAMVGGIVSCYTGIKGIPEDWREYREPLPAWAFKG